MIRFIIRETRDYLSESKALGGHPSHLQPSGNPPVFWPVPPGYSISSYFGPRTVSGGSKFHKGIDFAVPIGTDVMAIADGTVVRTAPHSDFGSMVMIQHGDGTISLYGHLSDVIVDTGDVVDGGFVIGKSGNTGRSTGPHMHLGIFDESTPLSSSGPLGPIGEHAMDPIKYMNDLHAEGLKWSQETGQSAKVFPEPLKGYEHGKAPELYRSV